MLADGALQVLLEITKICLTEASALLTDTQQLAQHIRQTLEASKPKEEEGGSVEETGSDNSVGIEDVRQYFEEHHARRAQEQSDSQTTVNPGAFSLVLTTAAMLQARLAGCCTQVQLIMLQNT